MKNREIFAGGLVRDIWFVNEDELQKYMDKLHCEVNILDKVFRADCSLIVRLLTSYNDSPLIQLYEED